MFKLGVVVICLSHAQACSQYNGNNQKATTYQGDNMGIRLVEALNKTTYQPNDDEPQLKLLNQLKAAIRLVNSEASINIIDEAPHLGEFQPYYTKAGPVETDNLFFRADTSWANLSLDEPNERINYIRVGYRIGQFYEIDKTQFTKALDVTYQESSYEEITHPESDTRIVGKQMNYIYQWNPDPTVKLKISIVRSEDPNYIIGSKEVTLDMLDKNATFPEYFNAIQVYRQTE